MIAKPNVQHPVIECFGPTVQGEGIMAGIPCYFIRFGGCDYRCSWCDTKYAVDPRQVKAESTMLSPQEIVDNIHALDGYAEWIVLSGGNPALQHADELVNLLQAEGYYLMIETQGTIWRPWLASIDHVTVSPKPPSSGNPTSMEQVRSFREKFAMYSPRLLRDMISYKVVIFDEADLDYLRVLVNTLPAKYPVFASVGNDVGGDSTEDLLKKYRWLVDRILEDPDMGHVRILPQLHVLLWGNQRGV